MNCNKLVSEQCGPYSSYTGEGEIYLVSETGTSEPHIKLGKMREGSLFSNVISAPLRFVFFLYSATYYK